MSLAASSSDEGSSSSMSRRACATRSARISGSSLRASTTRSTNSVAAGPVANGLAAYSSDVRRYSIAFRTCSSEIIMHAVSAHCIAGLITPFTQCDERGRRDSSHKRESPKAGTLRLRGKGLPKQLWDGVYAVRILHATSPDVQVLTFFARLGLQAFDALGELQPLGLKVFHALLDDGVFLHRRAETRLVLIQ